MGYRLALNSLNKFEGGSHSRWYAPCSTKCGPWTSSIGLTWEAVRSADSKVPPPARPTKGDSACNMWGALPQPNTCGGIPSFCLPSFQILLWATFPFSEPRVQTWLILPSPSRGRHMIQAWPMRAPLMDQQQSLVLQGERNINWANESPRGAFRKISTPLPPVLSLQKW